MKIDNGTGGSRETSTGKPGRVDEGGRESINFFAELKQSHGRVDRKPYFWESGFHEDNT